MRRFGIKHKTLLILFTLFLAAMMCSCGGSSQSNTDSSAESNTESGSTGGQKSDQTVFENLAGQISMNENGMDPSVFIREDRYQIYRDDISDWLYLTIGRTQYEPETSLNSEMETYELGFSDYSFIEKGEIDVAGKKGYWYEAKYSEGKSANGKVMEDDPAVEYSLFLPHPEDPGQSVIVRITGKYKEGESDEYEAVKKEFVGKIKYTDDTEHNASPIRGLYIDDESLVNRWTHLTMNDELLMSSSAEDLMGKVLYVNIDSDFSIIDEASGEYIDATVEKVFSELKRMNQDSLDAFDSGQVTVAGQDCCWLSYNNMNLGGESICNYVLLMPRTDEGVLDINFIFMGDITSDEIQEEIKSIQESIVYTK